MEEAIENPGNLIIVEDLGDVSVVVRSQAPLLVGAEHEVKLVRSHPDIENPEGIAKFLEVGLKGLNYNLISCVEVEVFPMPMGERKILILGDVLLTMRDDGGEKVWVNRTDTKFCSGLGTVPRPLLELPLQYLAAIDAGDVELRKRLAQRIAQYPPQLSAEPEVGRYLCRDHISTQEDLEARWSL